MHSISRMPPEVNAHGRKVEIRPIVAVLAAGRYLTDRRDGPDRGAGDAVGDALLVAGAAAGMEAGPHRRIARGLLLALVEHPVQRRPVAEAVVRASAGTPASQVSPSRKPAGRETLRLTRRPAIHQEVVAVRTKRARDGRPAQPP